MLTSSVCGGVVGLAVYTEAALFHGPQLLQLLVQQVHCLLHALPLGHGHLAHAARQSRALNGLKPKAQPAKPQSISQTRLHSWVDWIGGRAPNA